MGKISFQERSPIMTTTSKIGVLDRCKLISPVFQEKYMTGPDYCRMKDMFLKIIVI